MIFDTVSENTVLMTKDEPQERYVDDAVELGVTFVFSFGFMEVGYLSFGL